jgi:hypothetical protein
MYNVKQAGELVDLAVAPSAKNPKSILAPAKSVKAAAPADEGA